MNKKTVQAKIFDPDNENFITDIEVEIELVPPSNPNGKPHYEVIGTIKKPFVEICDKNLILELNPELRVSALFILITSSAPWFTEFKIKLLDSILWESEWFESL